MQRSKIQEHFIRKDVNKAVINSRLPYNHPIAAVLEAEAEIIGDGAGYVRVPDGAGGWMMLEDRIKELMADPRFRDTIPNPTKVAKTDLTGVRDNFESIANGTAIVE